MAKQIASVKLIFAIFIICIKHVNFISAQTTGSSSSVSNYFCPETLYNSSEFGEFVFKITRVADAKGVLVTAACPLGFRDDGAEPINLKSVTNFKNIKEQKESQSGARRRCVLKNVYGLKFADWEPETEIVVTDCRATYAVRLAKNATETLINVPTIDQSTFRRAMLFLKALRMEAEKDYNVAKTFLESVSKMLGANELYETPDIAAQTMNLFYELDKYAIGAELNPGYRVKVTSPKVTVQSARFDYTVESVTSTTMTINDYTSEIENVKIHLPAEAIKMSLSQGENPGGSPRFPRFKVTAFSEDLFFHWEGCKNESGNKLPPTTTNKTVDYEDEFQNNLNHSNIVGNWRVFSVDIVGAKITNLTNEFEYIFYLDHGRIDEYKWECVYWNETAKRWSTEGMRSFKLDNAIICKSSHLTAFSVLIDPLPLPFPGSDYAPINNSIHSHILSILSSLGSALSIVGLAGTILTYGLFRCLRKERSNRILLNLSVSLFFMHLLSISSGKELWNEKCFTPSILLHYFLHTSLWWMLMEAHHMHQLLISVFVQPESRFLTKRSVLAWGIPLIIVGVCGAVRPEVYYTGRNDLCVIAAHLNLPLYYIGYLAPAILILFVNFFVFCRIFNVLYKQTKRQRKQSCVGKKNGVKTSNVGMGKVHLNEVVGDSMKTRSRYVMLSPTQIKGAITVMILVGVGWIVGLLAVGPFEVFFKYLFCICNAGQGALIFVFRVALHPQACRQWRKAILGLTFDSTEVSTTSSTSLNSKGKQSFSASPNFISASSSVENSLTPSNPAAQDLANKLALMMRDSEGQPMSRMPL